MERLKQALSAAGIAYKENEPLSAHCTFRIGGPADVFILPENEAQLCAAIKLAKEANVKYYLLGNGSNILFEDAGYRGAVINVSAMKSAIGILENICFPGKDPALTYDAVVVGADKMLSSLCMTALENSLTGLEFAYGIPGTVGGAVYMNAGAYGGEMKDVLVSVRYLTAEGETVEIPAEQLDLRYRHSIFEENGGCILSAKFHLARGNASDIRARMNDLMARGVRNVIEMTNRYMGRNVQFMLDVMRETGINVVACTGYYQDAFFPEHVATRSVQELAQEMVDEIEQGIDGTDLKAGIIAEIGSSEGKITPLEEKVFIAAALAHNQTGRPISTHTSFSTMGLEQLALLQAHGVDLSRVTVGHCDLKDNLDNILKMIDLGAYVQFDTIGKNSYYPDEKRIAMLHALRDRGLLNRVMLSMDITRRSHLKANGGYGYDFLLTTFIPQLRQSGFSQADVDVMLRENPSQFFQ